MPTDSLYTRRQLLGVTGSAAVVGLAGCTGTQSNSTPDGAESTSNHTETHHDETDGESGHSDEGDNHEDDGHGHEEGVGEPTETAEVGMLSADDGEHFAPHVVRVTVGGTVTWTNESGSHSTTAYHPDNDQPQLVPDGAAAWDSGLLSEEGATFEHTFETEGVYHYVCTPHESVGMLGSVIVGEPDAHGQPALEEPPEDKPDNVQEKIHELNEMCNKALGHDH